MSIWVLANTVAEYAARVVATDTTPTATSDQSKVGCIKGGPRHLKWTSDHATAARRLSYVNKNGILDANFCVVVDAKAHDGKTQTIISSATYSSSETTLDSRTLGASDYVGIGGRDFVFPFAADEANRQAFSVGYTSTDYRKTARQIYFSQGIEFDAMPASSQISIQPASIHAAAFPYMGQYYSLWGQATLEFQDVSRATLDAFLELPRTDPMFLYDDTEGDALPETLWHCIILAEKVVPLFDDDHYLGLQVGILRDWQA
jgi:hypothetical protein